MKKHNEKASASILGKQIPLSVVRFMKIPDTGHWSERTYWLIEPSARIAYPDICQEDFHIEAGKLPDGQIVATLSKKESLDTASGATFLEAMEALKTTVTVVYNQADLTTWLTGLIM